MLQPIGWLLENIPFEDSFGLIILFSILLSTLRLCRNLEMPDKVIGILDWELSTLGNQMCDVAYSCLFYVGDISHEKVKHNGGLEMIDAPQGVPYLEEYLAGKPWPLVGWKFYIAFSFFRGASILADSRNHEFHSTERHRVERT